MFEWPTDAEQVGVCYRNVVANELAGIRSREPMDRRELVGPNILARVDRGVGAVDSDAVHSAVVRDGRRSVDVSESIRERLVVLDTCALCIDRIQRLALRAGAAGNRPVAYTRVPTP